MRNSCTYTCAAGEEVSCENLFGKHLFFFFNLGNLQLSLGQPFLAINSAETLMIVLVSCLFFVVKITDLHHLKERGLFWLRTYTRSNMAEGPSIAEDHCSRGIQEAEEEDKPERERKGLRTNVYPFSLYAG